MISLMQFYLIVLAAFFAVFFAWRFASQQAALPCPPWLAWLVELDNPFFVSNRASSVIAGLDVKPGMLVLDAGCGPGRLAIPLALSVGQRGRVVAVDLQAEMLERAKAKAERQRIKNIEFYEVQLGANELTFRGFDRAVMVEVLGEIPNQEAALRELWHALKPGGVLGISEVIADPHFQSRKHVTELTREVGFREIFRFGGRLAYTLYLERLTDDDENR
jgi:ubiquinone/menaquinone biosynthesis C-methylase UbiE